MDKFYQDVLRESGAGYWEWNVHANTGYFSPEYKAMLGYGPNELNDPMAFWDKLIHPDDLGCVKETYQAVLSNKDKNSIHKEVRYLHKQGTYRWMRSTSLVVKHDSEGKPLVMAGCIVDITEKKENNLALTKVLSFLEKTSNAANIGNWELDIKTGAIFWDDVTKRIHGVEQDYIPTLSAAILFYKEGPSREAISTAVALAIQNGISYDLELELITQQGKTLKVRTLGYAEFKDAKCIRLHGVFQDIDKQHKLKSQLTISEEQFQGVFEHTAIGMAIINLTGTYLRTNKRFCEITGYTTDELYSLTIKDTTHPDDISKDLANLKLILTDQIKSFSVDKRYIHKAGHMVWVNLTVTLIKDIHDNPLHFIGQVIDISESKKDKEEITRINQELKAILNAGTEVSIISTDIDGTITHFSKGAENLLGYTAKEIENIHTPSIIHVQSEIAAYYKDLSTYFGIPIDEFKSPIAYGRKGNREKNIWNYVKKDGTIFPVQLSVTAIKNNENKTTGYLGIAIDISKIKDAEKALIESQSQLNIALESSGEGIWDLNLDSQTVFFSSQGKSILGYEDNEVGDNLNDLLQKIHADDINSLKRSFNKHLLAKSDTFIHESRILTHDNAYKWLLVRGKVIEWCEKNKPLRIIGTFHDISERKENELEYQNAIDIVSEQNKRLLNFTYIVSHNLRSHSANFELGFNLLNDKDSTLEDKLDIIQQLKGVSEKLSDTINNLNEVVAIQTNINKHRKKINLHQYIENTLSLLSGEIIKHDAIINNTIPPTLDINYNPAYLESIILNFLTNALKYRRKDILPHIELSCFYEKENSIVLQIKDNGLGIDLQRHGEDLFGMYKTFHRNIDSKGIGLFITKNQVEAMGGTIEVESDLGKGTTFKIHLTESRIKKRKAK